jgi:hypothetical protein
MDFLFENIILVFFTTKISGNCAFEFAKDISAVFFYIGINASVAFGVFYLGIYHIFPPDLYISLSF